MGNKIGVYGVPQMLEQHGKLRVMYPTEKEAAERILNPDAPRFIEAPNHPGEIWCPGHRDFTSVACFSPDSSRPNGRRGYCRACERRMEKERRAKKALAKQGVWYCNPPVLVQKTFA